LRLRSSTTDPSSQAPSSRPRSRPRAACRHVRLSVPPAVAPRRQQQTHASTVAHAASPSLWRAAAAAGAGSTWPLAPCTRSSPPALQPARRAAAPRAGRARSRDRAAQAGTPRARASRAEPTVANTQAVASAAFRAGARAPQQPLSSASARRGRPSRAQGRRPWASVRGCWSGGWPRGLLRARTLLALRRLPSRLRSVRRIGLRWRRRAARWRR
jgi:hypothetical protein